MPENLKNRLRRVASRRTTRQIKAGQQPPTLKPGDVLVHQAWSAPDAARLPNEAEARAAGARAVAEAIAAKRRGDDG
ncbi:MAG: hypothetical protein GXY03_00215 [Solirubrobacterales bacterium]|nr:hypothetical protein [Solirubrobacterales bacterium]